MIKRVLCAAVIVGGSLAVAASPRASSRDVANIPLQDPQTNVTITGALTGSGFHPKIGMQSFQLDGGDAALGEAAQAMTEVLWNDLDFEREFYMIPLKASAAIPVAKADALPTTPWTELGAEFVIVATVRPAGQEYAVELRMMSVRGDSAGRSAFAALYEHCTTRNPRYCAHAIADDIHKQVRAVDGVARTKLAFASDRDGAAMAGRPMPNPGVSKEIYIADYDGASQRRFTINQSLNINPAWSPDGGLLAYTSYVSGIPDIYVANLAQAGRALGRPAGGNVRVQNFNAAWSPDGTKLAFASTRSGNFDIWVVNSDGTGLTNLTNTPTSEVSPTWSPNGAEIAFVSGRTGAPQIYVMSSNGTNVDRLTSGNSDRPTWSTLGFIAYTTGPESHHDIAIIDRATKRVSILTDGIGDNESPAVAPNGRHIAFTTTRWGGKQQIAVIDREGKNIRKITEVGNNHSPNWQPIAR